MRNALEWQQDSRIAQSTVGTQNNSLASVNTGSNAVNEMRKALAVPYYAQPTPITCQSTCLKMYSKYLETKRSMSSIGANKNIQDIWKEINSGTERPVQARNSYTNMKWWLDKYFHPTRFEIKSTMDPDDAIEQVVASINRGYPVMVSTNHDRTTGHIILIIGYSGYARYRSNPNIKFISHDPYGKFDPQLASQQYGKRRYEFGMSLQTGGETGPGRAVQYDYDGIRRIRKDKHSSGTFYLIMAKA